MDGNHDFYGANRLTGRARGVLAFLGLSVLCGVAVHLVAELAALGVAADALLIFSARHIPLAILTLLALAAVACAATPGRYFRHGGGGLRLFLIALMAQIVVFAVTEAGEGLPIGSGDLAPALIAAFLAAVLGAFFVARYQARVIEAFIDLFLRITADSTSTAPQAWKRIDAHVRVWRHRAVLFAASRRPPPAALATQAFCRIWITGAVPCSEDSGPLRWASCSPRAFRSLRWRNRQPLFLLP